MLEGINICQLNCPNAVAMYCFYRLQFREITIRRDRLHAIDDFYFDDESWVIRYIVVDTGGWLTGRTVILSPQAIESLSNNDKAIEIALTKQQVEQSPSYNKDKQIQAFINADP